MSDQDPGGLKRQIKELRDEVARLISENLELERQLEDLRRAKTDASVDALAASAINSIRQAEEAFAELSTDGSRYVISELQTRYQGVIVPQGEHLGFRVPLPEYGSAPGHLGMVQMTFNHTPPPASAPSSPAPPTPTITRNRLSAALEQTQLSLINWPRQSGVRIAGKMVDLLTHLLGGALNDPTALVEDVRQLRELLAAFSDAIRLEKPPEAMRAFRTALKQLNTSLAGLDPAAGVVDEKIAGLAASVEQLNQSLSAFVNSIVGFVQPQPRPHKSYDLGRLGLPLPFPSRSRYNCINSIV